MLMAQRCIPIFRRQGYPELLEADFSAGVPAPAQHRHLRGTGPSGLLPPLFPGFPLSSYPCSLLVQFCGGWVVPGPGLSL
jgi:hypothetical protein